MRRSLTLRWACLTALGASEFTLSNNLSRYLDSVGMHGIMCIGKPDMSLCEVPVSAGCIGLILLSKAFGHMGIMTREDYYGDK